MLFFLCYTRITKYLEMREVMYKISLDNVKKYMDTTLVLKDITFLVTEGEKVGIIGENGSGKTTILKLIAGTLKMNHWPGYPYAPTPLGYDEGFVTTPKDITIAYLEQIPDYKEDMRVVDVLNLAFLEVYEIEEQLRQLEVLMQTLSDAQLERTLKKYSEVTQLYEVKGGYEVREKLNKICKGLGFSEEFLNQNFHLLSGGEKTSVSLGKLLMDTPDVLLLDEPTNHLDIESVEWLEEYLKSYKGTVITVSHDRYFLDHVVDKIIEVEDKICRTFYGNYSDYKVQKEELLRLQAENYKEQKKEIASMEQTIKDLRDWGNRADNNKFFKRAKSIQTKLDKMDKLDRPSLERQNMKLQFKQQDRSGNNTIIARELYKSFGEKHLLKNAEMLIHYGEKIALIGANGSGKTTFLNMLLGYEEADKGEVTLGSNVKVAYLPQNISFKNEEMTVLDYFREDISILEGKAREYLAKFMFYGGNVFKKIKHLSGGERIRLYLSVLLYQDVNLLILDEPTNHLDTPSIENIEESLLEFKGTIFFISHDRYFTNRIANRILAIEEYQFANYLGGYDFYKEIKDARKAEELAESEVTMGLREKAEKSKKDKVKKDKKNDAVKNTPKVNLAKVELQISQLEEQLKELESSMELYLTDHEKLNELYAEQEEKKALLNELMEVWLESSEI